MLADVTRQLVWTSNCPAWLLLLAGGAACGAVVWLYRLERAAVPGKVGLALTGLRTAIVLAVVIMLAKPVVRMVRTDQRQGYVAVLVDHSASMRIADRQLPPHRRIRLAEMLLDIPAARRACRLDLAGDALDATGDAIAGQAGFLARLAAAGPDQRAEQLARRPENMAATVNSARETIGEQIDQCSRALAGKVTLDDADRTQLLDVKGRLAGARRQLEQAAGILSQSTTAKLADEAAGLLAIHKRVTAVLEEAAPMTNALGEKLDAACYASLADADRAAVDKVSEMTRLQIATAVLNRQSGADPSRSLLEALSEQYRLKTYHFDDGPGMQTNLTAALQKLHLDLAGQRAAGVIVLSDGRHNTGESPIAVARQLAAQNTPVLGVIVGSAQPPTDAAVTSLEAPGTVYTDDAFGLQAGVKLDGLKGKDIAVKLLAGEKMVDSVVLTPPADTFRTRVRLTDTPKTAGPNPYRIVIEEQDGEVFTDNNAYPVTLSVTADRTQLLLIDGRPRWEYRYLKNLFATRDKAVHLQHVLLQPVLIAGQAEPRPAERPASVTNPSAEAFGLPASTDEWLKFDVIILGDVPPDVLSDESLDALERFVGDRGGTLVVLAGANYMPAAYAATPLAQMLGVTFTARPQSDTPASQPAAGVAGACRLILSDEGRRSELMRLDDSDDVEAVWAQLPSFHWRSAIVQARPSAKVLCYALAEDAPEFMTGAPAGPKASADELRKRRDFIARNALVTTCKYGMGKVMFVGLDATWRLRYRRGDLYHHRLWGQVLRWATANKLPAGTTLVKLGTDRARYAPGGRPIVRAKIVNADYSPIVSEQVAVKVLRDGRIVHRVPMRSLHGSPGMYEAGLPLMDSGAYRVVLDAPAAEAVMRLQGERQVAVDFAVDPASPVEQIDLAADPSLLAELAAASTRGKVVQPHQVWQLLSTLPPGRYATRDVSSQALWCDWKLLTAILLIAAAEWIIRKKAALA